MYDLIIVGGGAAGMFAAAVLSEEAPDLSVLILEKGKHLLSKVRVSGGGRCNLTHSCPDLRVFVQNYPRGGRELIGPLHRFGPDQTAAWFEAHGVPLKTEADGRVFPASDHSESVIAALLETVRAEIQTGRNVVRIKKNKDGFEVTMADGGRAVCSRLLLASGGGGLVEGLGLAVEPCVPSLFTFKCSDADFTALAGISVPSVRLAAPGLKAEGSLLITHRGIAGPAALKLSAYGARSLAEKGYCFNLKINWDPSRTEIQVFDLLKEQRILSSRKQISTWSPVGLPVRLWKMLVRKAGMTSSVEWVSCSDKGLRHLAAEVCRFALTVSGKNAHREEFVTCGGVRLKDVDFKGMESRSCPGLHLAGEVLDMDALTGGYNLQAAWTTAWAAAEGLIR